MLAQQIANLFGGGIDKKGLALREQFSIDNMHLISDAALHPLDGERWWLRAEDPWQCLAACIELHNAMQSSDPAAFESCLPVHQDGSCNGLQHYAALGRDEEGGKAVNLLPGDEPADVYKCAALSRRACTALTLIAQGHRESCERGGTTRGSNLPRGRHASWSRRPQAGETGTLSRRTSFSLPRRLTWAQTVMTSVYGVTFMGAREQIWNRYVCVWTIAASAM